MFRLVWDMFMIYVNIVWGGMLIEDTYSHWCVPNTTVRLLLFLAATYGGIKRVRYIQAQVKLPSKEESKHKQRESYAQDLGYEAGSGTWETVPYRWIETKIPTWHLMLGPALLHLGWGCPVAVQL